MTPIEYRAQITALDQAGLLALWANIRDRLDTPGWPEGIALEYLILRSFEIEGASVRWPYQVKLESEVVEQIDGVIYSGAISCVVEAKAHKSPINIEPIAKLRGKLMRRPASAIGAIFSVSGFTSPALVLAQYLAPQTILLWEADDLQLGLEKKFLCKGLEAKFRYAVEYGLPSYALATEFIS